MVVREVLCKRTRGPKRKQSMAIRTAKWMNRNMVVSLRFYAWFKPLSGIRINSRLGGFAGQGGSYEGRGVEL